MLISLCGHFWGLFCVDIFWESFCVDSGHFWGLFVWKSPLNVFLMSFYSSFHVTHTHTHTTHDTHDTHDTFVNGPRSKRHALPNANVTDRPTDHSLQ